MTTVKVAAVQAEPVWLDLDGTLDKTLVLIEQAAQQGAELVAFPELWLPGYPLFLLTTNAFEEMPYVLRYRANSMAVDSPQMARLRQAARENHIAVAFGFSERGGRSLYMSQAILGADGEILMHRRKLKPTHVERILFGEGDGSDLKVVDTPMGRMGALNCAEHMQPLNKHAMAALDEQIHIAAWPMLDTFGGRALSGSGTLAVNMSYALETGTFVIVSTQVITERGLEVFRSEPGTTTPDFHGGGYARVFAPDSRLLSETLEPDEEGIVTAELDLKMLEFARFKLDPVGHYARPDIFSVTINRHAQPTFVDEHDAPAARAASAPSAAPASARKEASTAASE